MELFNQKSGDDSSNDEEENEDDKAETESN